MLRKITLLVALTLGFGVVHAKQTTKGVSTDAVALEDQRPTGPSARAQVFTVTGVDRADRVPGIQKSVCANTEYKSCFVALVDPLAQLAEVRITPHPGQIVDRKKLKDEVKTAGFELK